MIKYSQLARSFIRSRLVLALSSLTVFLLIAGCTSVAGSPEQVVKTYLQAIVTTDQAGAVNASCSEWEEQARLDSDAYQGVQAQLENLDCKMTKEDGDGALVSCSGQIRYSYAGGEDQTEDLSGRTFRAIIQDGEWRMCGLGQ